MVHHWNRRSFLNIRLTGHITYLQSLSSYTRLFTIQLLQRKTTKGCSNCRAPEDPLLADPVNKYVKMSRKKHPFKPFHKLHNGLRRLCETNTETAKTVVIANTTIHKIRLHGYGLEAIWLKMISLARTWESKFPLTGCMQLTCTVKSYFTLNAKLPMPKHCILTLGAKTPGLAPRDPHH